MSMCLICEQYLCYVHSVVWIHNPHITLFKFLFKSASPWTKKFSGQQRWNASMPFITRYTRPNIRRDKNLGQRIWAPSNPWTNKYSIRPIHGRTNIQYVQPMDDKMHTDLKLVKNTHPDHGRGNEEYITKTIQHMDEAKVIKKLQV